MEDLQPLRTVFEDDFGLSLCDVYYLPRDTGWWDKQKLFVRRLQPGETV